MEGLRNRRPVGRYQVLLMLDCEQATIGRLVG